MTNKKIKLIVRQAEYADIPGIAALSLATYGKRNAMDEAMLAGQLNTFPEGQFVAEYNGVIVGYCATFIISGAIALKPHSWGQITGHGFASRHNAKGDYLYGMEVCVSRDYQRLRIGQRLYNARKRLCIELGLRGIVFGGRLPLLRKRIKYYDSVEIYVDHIKAKKIKDPAVNFHLDNDFDIIGIIKNYDRDDKDSMGYATHMLWKNPELEHGDVVRHGQISVNEPYSVRIASVQFQVRKVTDFHDFAKQIEYFVDVASDYEADFILFPELLTIPLLSCETEKLSPQESIEKITQYTDMYIAMMQHLAVSYNINIIGGSHPTMVGDRVIENHAYVFLRSGEMHVQSKLHPTPNERYYWNIKGGNSLNAIQTDCGPIGVLICYDSEFPEPARYLADQGAKILFVPFCTDERQGYLRVRYCCQARAVENQMYVVTSGVVGNLPDVENMDVHYAQSGIFTPCDFPFARDGIAALADSNTEMIIFADVRLDELTVARNSGTVQNMKDRRFDLYRIEWRGKAALTN